MSYKKYKKIMSKIADVNYSAAVLHWDQETYMPKNGAQFRAQQLSTLAGIAHELSTSDELGAILNQLSESSDLSEKEKRNIEESQKKFKDQKKYSTNFVEKLSRAISETFQAWQQAKKKDDFASFAIPLKKLVQLKREECEILGYENHPYDAMLNQYEPGAKTADLEVLFADVRAQLVDFVRTINDKPQNDDKFMFKKYAKEKQWEIGIDFLKQMGYDFDAGRQDITTHPFTTNFSSDDVRVTTRINENDFNEMLWSCIHEGGHALYEQGLPKEEYGLPSGESISLGIHESQSRLWENNVGRSWAYWKKNYSNVQQVFPENLKDVSAEAFYKGMNIVKPSFVRTAADELTYHFHIMIRFEIEKGLMDGSIEVEELPNYWKQKYKEYLNIEVPSDAMGVLQDIHWSHGSFGYFPTYSLGSFYAAQFFAQAKKEMPNLNQQIENGDLQPLLNWLREKIHQHGKTYSAEELCVHITGEKLDFNFFMEYAREKYGKLYP